MMDKKIIVTRTEKIWMGEDGILRCEALPVAQDIEDARENVQATVGLAGGKKAPAFIDARAAVSVSREARVHYAGQENAKILSSAAVLVESPLSRVIGNFFLGLNRTIFPARVFTSETEALTWLSRFKSE